MLILVGQSMICLQIYMKLSQTLSSCTWLARSQIFASHLKDCAIDSQISMECFLLTQKLGRLYKNMFYLWHFQSILLCAIHEDQINDKESWKSSFFQSKLAIHSPFKWKTPHPIHSSLLILSTLQKYTAKCHLALLTLLLPERIHLRLVWALSHTPTKIRMGQLDLSWGLLLHT